MDSNEILFESSTLDISTIGCYHEGEPILCFLRETTEDSATQDKKIEILSKLAAGDYDAQARMDIGDHVNSPLEALLLLTEDANVDVRFALAENYNIHESVLNLLREDSNPYVAHRAQETLRSLIHRCRIQTDSLDPSDSPNPAQ
jgi:hypothetical protein